MRLLLITLVCSTGLVALLSLTSPADQTIGAAKATIYFKLNATVFAGKAIALKSAIESIDSSQPATIVNARNRLKDCRLSYKRIEFFLEYFFKSNATFYNAAPKVEVEEPFMEWQTPTGLQVIESLLYDEAVYSQKNALLEQADALASSAVDLPGLLYNFTADDKQVLESVRLELIRVCTMGITGFDAPVLKSGIDESASSFEALETVLKPYLTLGANPGNTVAAQIRSSIVFLRAGKGFDAFDRLAFLTNHALPLQQALGSLIKSLGLEVNSTQSVLNYDAPQLFDKDAINVSAFPRSGLAETPGLINLGAKLFNETLLSGNNRISCATCHQPARHFTDALPKSIAFNGHSTVDSNAPSLIYSAYQYEQFWDGRAKSLEEQVLSVLSNRLEMNGDPLKNIGAITRNAQYATLFKTAFPQIPDTLKTIDKVAIAIAAFVRTLNYRNSPFDDYMKGKESALSSKQKNGFNLFMGKAMCGTCHFAPLFNGLVPPLYNRTELEVLGTTKTEDFLQPVIDDDKGRYNAFAIEYYDRAFKTPTVRNVSATAPYMHNGSINTLEKVVEFYNKGGGKGIGLALTNQTLAPTPLNLTGSECADIVAFLRSLEDDLHYKP